jgi:SAM-dependent methyltransferase
MNRSEPDRRDGPPAILTWGAAKLEGRTPRVVHGLRRARDRGIVWRASVASRHYPDPGKPFSARYLRNHRRFLAAALDDRDLIERMRGGAELPAGHGVGYDERVVELPWLLARGPRGRMLDAGSALNHPHVLDRLLPGLDSLCSCTLAPESRSFNERGVSYVYADLRELPFRDGWFDTVASISTLEHVGMDVGQWGAVAPAAADPRPEVDAALGELRRVTRPGGRLLITVPYGRREDHGWLRQFDREDVERLVAGAGPGVTETTVFAYDREGWRRSSLDEAAGAAYQPSAIPDDRPVEDMAAAARAVACIEVTL